MIRTIGTLGRLGRKTDWSFPHWFEATGRHNIAVWSNDVNLLRLDGVGVGVGPRPRLHNLLRNYLRRSEAIWSVSGHGKMIGILWYLHTGRRLPGGLLDLLDRMSRVDTLANILTGLMDGILLGLFSELQSCSQHVLEIHWKPTQSSGNFAA